MAANCNPHPTTNAAHFPLQAPPPYEGGRQQINQAQNGSSYGFYARHPHPAPPPVMLDKTPPFISGTPLVPESGLHTPAGMMLPQQNTTPRPLYVRDDPIQLSDGKLTQVQYINGEFAKAMMAMLFIALLPFGLCFLAFLPLCMRCKWMKDIEHIDTETQNTVGLYRRCCPDAPGEYTFYRYPPGAEPGEDGTITQQPIPQQIIFRDRPVKLPDGNTTITHRRIGLCNYSLFCGLYWGFVWLFLCPLGFIGFCSPCLMDVEHIHPVTREVVGVYYRSRCHDYYMYGNSYGYHNRPYHP